MAKKWKQILCRIFGHKPVYIIRWRMVHDGTCKKSHPKYYSPRDYGRGHYVPRGRMECLRCGKKLGYEQKETRR